jgi:hypothetical protein
LAIRLSTRPLTRSDARIRSEPATAYTTRHTQQGLFRASGMAAHHRRCLLTKDDALQLRWVIFAEQRWVILGKRRRLTPIS